MKQKTIYVAIFAMVCIFVLSSSMDAARRLPDLTITKVTVNRNCELVVKVRNNGPGMLPNRVYTKHHPKSAGVYIYVNGKKWGGASIWKFDPGKNLKAPGGTAKYVSNYKVVAPVSVKAVVDLWNDVEEAKENNNSLEVKRLDCDSGGQKLPDLIVKDIELIADCKIEVTFANIGTAGVPASYYDLPDAVAAQMYNGSQAWGGLILKGIDPLGKLKVPGSMVKYVWFPRADNLNLSCGWHSLKVIVDVHGKLTESNEGNNTLVKRVNCECDEKKPDIGLSGAIQIGENKKTVQWGDTVVLTPNDAHLISNGNPAFDLYYTIQENNNVATAVFKNRFYFNGSMVSQQTAMQLTPKQVRDVHTQAYLGPQSGKLVLKLDDDNDIDETDESNNSGFIIIRFTGFK